MSRGSCGRVGKAQRAHAHAQWWARCALPTLLSDSRLHGNVGGVFDAIANQTAFSTRKMCR